MHEQIRANQRRAVLLIAAMAVLLLAIGYALAEYVAPGAGLIGVFFAFIVWVIHSLVSYFVGSRILLSFSGARKIEKKDHPILFNIVEEMCVASGLSKVPDIYIIDDEALNAFATGRNTEHAVVAVTSGLLKELDRDELQGVIGHEISHVNNRDVLYMTLLGVMMGTIIFLADIGRRMMRHGSGTRTGGRRSRGGSGGNAAAILFIVAILLMILAPVIARILYFALSRRREYLADASSALYTRFPEGLARALEKLGGSSKKLRATNAAIAPLYIVNPLRVTSTGLADLSSTHPPISQRVRILRSMGARAGLQSYNEAFRKVTGRPVGVVPFTALRETRDLPVVTPKAPPATDLAGIPLPVPTTAIATATATATAPLTTAMPMAVAAAAAEHIERIRTTTDLLWSLNDYIFIDCPCATRLKIPPVYAGKKIECPHCSRVHLVQRPAA